MTRRLAGATATGLVLAAAATATALGAFAASVQTSGTSYGAYTVPVPGNIRCSGLSSLLSSKIAWDAVTPLAGDSVSYVVTAPNSRQTTTTGTTYDLPIITLLPGQYAVQAQISSGWRSSAATITVSLTALGLLYLCSTP